MMASFHFSLYQVVGGELLDVFTAECCVDFDAVLVMVFNFDFFANFDFSPVVTSIFLMTTYPDGPKSQSFVGLWVFGFFDSSIFQVCPDKA